MEHTEEMSKNLYKDYYNAINAPDADEWAIERAQSIGKKIERIREYASWNGVSEEDAMEMFGRTEEMGG